MSVQFISIVQETSFELVILVNLTRKVKLYLNGVDGGPVGAATSYEDIYWIYYAPRTSETGATLGRELDGFVMAAWEDVQEGANWTFGGSIGANGTPVAGGEVLITDLNYMSGD